MTIRPPLLTALAAALALSACGGDSPMNDAGSDPFACPSNPPTVLMAGDGGLHDAVIGPICVQCHSGGVGAPPADYSDAGTARAALVNVTTAGYAPIRRVVPGNLRASMMYLKVSSSSAMVTLPDGGSGGDRMPQGLPPLSAAQVTLIKNWICSGAN